MSTMNGTKNTENMESLNLVTEKNVNRVSEKLPKVPSHKLLQPIKQKRGSSLRQVCAALSANLGPINTGMAFGFSAVALPQLEHPDSPIQINEDQASWIASLSAVTTPIGCILSGYLMDRLGRKKILISTQVPMILGWLLIAFSTRVEMIYAGRLLVGLGTGMVGAPARVYTAEATQPHLRGMLAALASVGVSLGVTLEYAMGAVFRWNTIALLSSLVPMIGFVTGWLLPESPTWLASMGRHNSCKDSLSKLRGRTCDIDREANALKSFNEQNNIHKPNWKETFAALVHPSSIKPFIILSLYFLIYQFSGVNPVTFYAVEVFKDAGTTMDANLATVILGIVRLFFTVVSCILMRKCGRRPLTFVSSVLCGLSMVGLGWHMMYGVQWKAEGTPMQAAWFPVLSIMVFTAAATIGYLVVPWVMIGEVYPLKVRGIIGGMTTCVAHFSIFLVVKTFPTMQHYISKHGTFILYGGISLAGTLFFYFFLPETKGRTLEEIEDYFCGRSKTLGKPKPQPEKHINNNRPIVLSVPKGEALP